MGDHENADLIRGMDIAFNSLFAVELLVRMAAEEFQFVFCEDVGWNLFDTFVVVTSLVDTFSSQCGFTLSYVRVLRVMRLTKTLRVIRLLLFASFVRHLRLMLLAIMECAVPLLWAVVLLFFLMFVFSVIFMQGVTNFIREAGPNDLIVERLLESFNGLTMTLLTLFMSISGGVSWGEVVQLLLEISDLYGVLFVLYVATMVLALLNIVTGIFVNEAVAMAQMDQALMREQEMDRQAKTLQYLKKLFAEIDMDDNGTVTLDEFHSVDQDHVKIILSVLGLQITDAIALFKILDVDGSKEVEIDEFVMGCMRLKGSTQTQVDIITSLDGLTRSVRRSCQRQRKSDTRLHAMEQHLQDLCHAVGSALSIADSVSEEEQASSVLQEGTAKS